MSLIDELGDSYCNLPNILQGFENELMDAEEKVDPSGHLLETSLSKNSAWLHYYDSRRNKLKTLVKFFKMESNRVRGELYRKYKENYSRSLGERDILKYIDADPEYLAKCEILIEIEEIEGEYTTVVEALQALNYSLGHMAKLRIANLEFAEI